VRQGQIEYLMNRITTKREEMILEATISGYTSAETLRISQELDELINDYQRLVDIRYQTTFQQFIKQTILFFCGSKYKLYNIR